MPIRKSSRYSTTNLKIPIYKEYLDEFATYEDTIIINQLLFADRELTVYSIKNLSLYDKSCRNLRIRLQKLVDRGIVSKRRNTLYGMYYYRLIKDYYPKSNKLVTLIESKDMHSGDYYTAALINFFRQQLLNGNETISISINELLNKLSIKKSRRMLTSRVNYLIEHNYIRKAELTGRIYNYELNPEKILNSTTPEIMNYRTDELVEILDKYLAIKNITTPESSKSTFGMMLIDGYDHATIKHIIAYLGCYNSNWSRHIISASHIRNNYEELVYEASLNISRRKANRYIYKLLHNLIHLPIKTLTTHTPKNEEQNNPIVSDEYLWSKIYKWSELNQYKIASLCNKYGVNVNGRDDVKDAINQSMLEVFNTSKRQKVCPFMLEMKNIHGALRRYFNSVRDHAPIDIYDIEDTLASEISTEDDNSSVQKEIANKFKSIPAKALEIIIDMLGFNGKKLTHREAAQKYEMPLSSFNNYIKPYLDEVQKLSGIKLRWSNVTVT